MLAEIAFREPLMFKIVDNHGRQMSIRTVELLSIPHTSDRICAGYATVHGNPQVSDAVLRKAPLVCYRTRSRRPSWTDWLAFCCAIRNDVNSIPKKSLIIHCIVVSVAGMSGICRGC